MLFHVPETIPAPRFALFQSVQITAQTHESVGVVVGLVYTSPVVAIDAGDWEHGWVYAVDRWFGLTPQQICDAPNLPGDAIVEIAESDLKATHAYPEFTRSK